MPIHGGGNIDDILSSIPMEGGGEDVEPDEEVLDIGLEEAMTELSDALEKGQPKAAAQALKHAVKLVVGDI